MKVKTYLNPNTWMNRKSDYEDLVNSVHICATKQVSQGIKNKYKEFKKPIITFSKIRESIFGFWFNSEQRLNLKLETSIYLKDNEKKLREKDYQYLKKNLDQLLDTILELSFIDVELSNFKNINLDSKENLMLFLWDNCVLKSQIYINQCNELKEILGNSDKLSRLFKKYLNINLEKDLIVLQGFYFITPEQQVILKCIEKASCSFTFFNLYDNRYENTFNFIRNFINEENGWTSDWEIESVLGYKGQVSVGEKFLSLFEELNEKIKFNEISILEYPDFNVFLQEVIMRAREMDLNERPIIVSTSADILNRMLETYFPEKIQDSKKKVNNYLNSPLGRLLINLHNIYDSQNYNLNFMQLVEIFSSGFIKSSNINQNANTLIKELYDIKSYCKNCKTIEDWKKRILKLKTFNEQVLSKFPVDDTRANRCSAHPFKRLSYANITLDNINAIFSHILTIESMLEELFGETEITTLDKHFKKLRDIIEKLLKVKDITAEEMDAINNLSESFSKVDSKIECLYSDIGDVLVYYLGGKDEENEEAQIIPFIEVDGLAFIENEKSKKYHITGLDEGGLPLGIYDLPYPLSKETIDELGKYNYKIRFLLYRNDSVKKISRYLLYIVLNFFKEEDIQLSWIRKFSDKENLDMSVYMSMLTSTSNKIPVMHRDPIYLDRENTLGDLEMIDGLKIFPDFKLEYNFCERRFLYSYILRSHSYFREEFHQKFIYGEIAKILCSEGLEKEDMLDIMKDIFPQWDDTFKEITGLKQSEIPTSINESTIFDGAKIDDRRLRMIFPYIKNKQLDEIKENDNKLDKKIKETMFKNIYTNTNTQECYCCPENWHCPLIRGESKDDDRNLGKNCKKLVCNGL